MRFVSIFLIANYSLLALLGHAGLHALAGYGGGCCGIHDHQGGGASNVTRGCCAHSSPGHTAGRNSSGSCPFEKRRAAASKQHVPSAPHHDSKNCRICEWHLKSQAASFSVYVFVIEQTGEFRIETPDVQSVTTAVQAVHSRGPPVVASTRVG